MIRPNSRCGYSAARVIAASLAASWLPSALAQQTGSSGAKPGHPRPPMYVEPTGPVNCVEYATSERHVYDTTNEWRYMCGSKTDGLTEADLRKVAAEHNRQMADTDHIVVIDTPRPPGTRGTNVNVVFNVNASGAPAGFATSFAQAEQYIESKWSNPITITINVSWANLGNGVIGATSSSNVNNVSYTNSRAGLVNGMDSDDSIQNFLPTGSSVPVRFNGTSGTVSNVSTVNWTKSNYRATVGTTTGSDASMQYNNTMTFDFDPTDGVTAGFLSLVDTIVHEVGHCQGFVSNADNQSATNVRPLDLFRFARVDRAGIGNTNPDTFAEFQTVAREVDYDNPNNDDAITDLIIGEYRMSDGTPYQASHFFEQSTSPGSALGIMQPALASGITFGPEYYRLADYYVFDAIGWDNLDACTAPTITQPPSAPSGFAGDSASFTVGATGTFLTYQWRKNAAVIAGATNPSYTILTMTPGDAGSYDCIVSNNCGTVTTNAVTLTYNLPVTINTYPSPVSACVGGTATFTVSATASPSPTYQWRKSGILLLGKTQPTLTINPVGVGNAGDYDCVITNPCGSEITPEVALTVGGAAITSQPSPQTVAALSPASFTVGVSGSPTGFQWRKDGIPLSNGGAISSADTATLSINPAAIGAAGSYDCVVTHSCGSTTSAAALLDVLCRPDWDHNERIEAADVAALVNDWFNSLTQGTLLGDYDGNHQVEPADIANFVADWFAALAGGC